MDFTPHLERWRQRHRLIGRLLADTPVVLCFGSRALLVAVTTGAPPGLQVVGAASSQSEGLQLVERLAPKLLVASDQLERGCGCALVAEVKRRQPNVQTLLVVSREGYRARLRAAMAAGCDAVVADARLGHGAIVAALRSLRSGGSYLDRQLRAAVLTPALDSRPALSPRELEVLSRVMRGEENSEIGRHLYVSGETVKTHMTSVLRKLGARDRTHAVAIALSQGLMDFSPLEGPPG